MARRVVRKVVQPTTSVQPVLKLMTGSKVRWSVMWLTKKGRRKEEEFEHDLNAAITRASELKAEGKRLVTIRSMNVGFPPPERYLPYKKRVVKKVKRGRKYVKVYSYVYVRPMVTVNGKGIMWCPYCREMRKFQKYNYKGYTLECCPMCGISERDYHVRAHNPALFKKYLAS